MTITGASAVARRRLARFWSSHAGGPGQPGRAAGAALVFTIRQRIALLAGCVLLIALRLPKAWLHGRFLGEEGTIFLAFAWHRPAAAALWHSFGGYLNIGANASTLLAARLVRAGILPLELAPYLTMGIALLFQSLPAILILTGRAAWLERRWTVVGALLALVMMPKTEEVFLNVLHIQFHLALAAALILTLDAPAGRAGRIGYAAILFAAPLCGPGAIVLWPFFALRGLLDRDPARLGQTAVFAAAIALQMLFFFVPSPVRGEMLDPATLAGVLLVRLAAMPIIVWKPGRISPWIYAVYLKGGFGCWLSVAAALLYFAVLIGLALRDRRGPAIWFIAPALTIAAVSFGGGMINSARFDWFSIGAGERYNFLPLVLISIGLLVLAARGRGRARRFCAALFLLTLLAGAASYVRPISGLADGPVWRDEVAAWRGDHDHRLASWPEEWTVDLSDRDRACAPPVSRGAGDDDPGYCESNWLERVRRARIAAMKDH